MFPNRAITRTKLKADPLNSGYRSPTFAKITGNQAENPSPNRISEKAAVTAGAE